MTDPDSTFEFELVIEEGRGGGALVVPPVDVASVWDTRGRVPVVATFDGHRYRGSLVPMGGRHVLGMTKAVRSATGKDLGDRVAVTLRRDSAERTVEVPMELATALAEAPDVRARYEGLSYTHRKEFARWVAEARKRETRDRRAAEAVEMIRAGRTR